MIITRVSFQQQIIIWIIYVIRTTQNIVIDVYCSSCHTDSLWYFASQTQELVCTFNVLMYYVRHISANREP
jgi:hypothetical protein